jgi:hypothetical protein
MLRDVIASGLQIISPQVLNVITDLDKTVNVLMSINVILRHFRLNIGAVQKQKSIAYSECVSVALVTQHTKGIRRCYLRSPVACLAPRHTFRKVIAHRMVF